MHLKYVCWTKAKARGTRDTGYLNKKTPRCNSDCSGAHDVWLRVPEGVHTKTDRLNDLQLQSDVEFDTHKCTGDYRTWFVATISTKTLSASCRFNTSLMGERKIRNRAYESKINTFWELVFIKWKTFPL